MSGKRSHNEEQPSSPPKRRKYHTNVEHVGLARRLAAEKPKDNLLVALRCYICASTSNEGLLPLEKQPNNPISRCHQNGGIWMAHRICAQLLNGVYVFKPSNSEEEVIRGLQRIDPDRFRLKCRACTHRRLKAHGAKIQCSEIACKFAYHPMCAKTTDGVSLTELVKTTDYDGGTGETIEYKLWCKMHNPNILAARRAAKASKQAIFYRELEAAKPGTTVSHKYTARGRGYVPIEGQIVQNDIQERRMLISDGEDAEWYGWDCIMEIIGGKSRDETKSHPSESPKEVDHENTQDSQTPTPIQGNTGVQEDVSSSRVADPLPATQLVFESPGPAPQPLRPSSAHEGPLRVIMETGIRKSATERFTLKGKSKPKTTTPTSVPTPAAALAPSTSTEAICASPSIKDHLPLRHQPRWDPTTTRAKDQRIREQVSTSYDILLEITDLVAPETPQDPTVSSPELNPPPDSPLSNQISDIYLQSRFQAPDTVFQDVLPRIAYTPTPSEQAMYEHQVTALLSPPIQALVDPDEQVNSVEGGALLGEDDMMELLVTPLEESGVEGDRGFEALGTHFSMSEFITFPESDTIEEIQSPLVPRVERSKPPLVLQRPSVGTQHGTPPKQYVDISVQTDDTASPPSPEFRRAACNEVEVMRPFLRRIMQKREWKDELDKMLNAVSYDLWRKGWVKDRENTTE